MNKALQKLAMVMLGTILFLSQSTNLVSSSPILGDIHKSIEGAPRFDHLTYLPLVIKDVNPVPNGGFELGRVNWSEFSSYSSNVLILNSGFPEGIFPHSGLWAAWMGREWWYPPQDDYIFQTITIPPDKPVLHFWYWIESSEPDLYHDTFKVLFYDGDPHIDWSLRIANNTLGWREQTIDLSSYAGVTSALQFYSHNDWNFASWIFLDDISLEKD